MVVAGCGLGIKMFRHSFSQSLILRTSQYLFLLLIRSCTKINIVTDSIKNEITAIYIEHMVLPCDPTCTVQDVMEIVKKNKLKESPWKYIMRLFNCTVNVSNNQSTVTRSSVYTRNHISLQNVLLASCCCVVQKDSLIPTWQKTIFANYITPESQIKKIVVMAP